MTLFWTAGMIFILAALNACSYIHSFTRFSGELFGLLISVRDRPPPRVERTARCRLPH